jgi:hypothetical protein
MNAEITESIIDLKQAEQNFKYAAPEFVDIAALELTAAEMKVDALLSIKKQKGPSAMDPVIREKFFTKKVELIVPQQEQIVRRKFEVNVVNCMNCPQKHLSAIGKNF